MIMPNKYFSITNLKFWATNERILELTLALLKDLSLGYTAVRKLFRLPDIQLLLNNHTVSYLLLFYKSAHLLIVFRELLYWIDNFLRKRR